MQPKFTRGGCLYMGWSDVSEFEHIYGQIFTTPSCVYDRLFTWTWMVDLNELIVWKTLIDINFFLFFDKVKSLGFDSCLYEIPKNDLVDHMKLWPPVTFPNVYCYLIETPGDHWGKAEGIQLCDFWVGQATTCAEAQFWLRQPWRNLPLFWTFPHRPSDFCPSTLLTRDWGITMGKLLK